MKILNILCFDKFSPSRYFSLLRGSHFAQGLQHCS